MKSLFLTAFANNSYSKINGANTVHSIIAVLSFMLFPLLSFIPLI